MVTKQDNDKKKVYEEPVVTKVEFDFRDRIASSYCAGIEMMDDGQTWCIY